MDESDISTQGNKDNFNEETLKIALEVNEALGRKGKSFKTFRNLLNKIKINSSGDDIVAVMDKKLSYTTVPPSTINRLRLTTQKAESITEQKTGNDKTSFENETNQDSTATESLPFTTENAKEIVKTEKQKTTPKIPTEAYEIETESVIEQNEDKGDTANEKLKMEKNIYLNKESTLTMMEDYFTTESTSSISTSGRVESSENYEGLEAESLTDAIKTKSFTAVNQPLTKSTTIEELYITDSITESSTRRSFTLSPRLELTTSTNKIKKTGTVENQNTLREPHFETITPRSLLLKNRLNAFKHFKTTTIASLDDSNDSDSTDEATTYSRLIRYRPTTPTTDGEGEDDREIQTHDTTTRRAFTKQKSTSSPTRNSFGIKESKFSTAVANPEHLKTTSENERTAFRKTSSNIAFATRLPFAGFTRNKFSLTEASYKANFPKFDHHEDTTESIAGETASTTEKNILKSTSGYTKHNFPTRKTYEKVTRRTQTVVPDETTENIYTQTEETSIEDTPSTDNTLSTMPQYNGVKSTEENSEEIPSTRELLSKNFRQTKQPYLGIGGIKTDKEFYSEGSLTTRRTIDTTEMPILETDSTVESKEENEINLEDSTTIHSPTSSSYRDINGFTVTTEFSKQSTDSTTYATERSSIDKEFSTQLAEESEEIIEKLDHSLGIKAKSNTPKEISVKGPLDARKYLDVSTRRRPFGSFSRTLTTEERKYSNSPIKGYSEKSFKQSTLPTRRPFGIFHRTTTDSLQDIETTTESVVENNKEESSSKSTLATKSSVESITHSTLSPIETTIDGERLGKSDQDHDGKDGTTTPGKTVVSETTEKIYVSTEETLNEEGSSTGNSNPQSKDVNITEENGEENSTTEQILSNHVFTTKYPYVDIKRNKIVTTNTYEAQTENTKEILEGIEAEKEFDSDGFLTTRKTLDIDTTEMLAIEENKTPEIPEKNRINLKDSTIPLTPTLSSIKDVNELTTTTEILKDDTESTTENSERYSLHTEFSTEGQFDYPGATKSSKAGDEKTSYEEMIENQDRGISAHDTDSTYKEVSAMGSLHTRKPLGDTTTTKNPDEEAYDTIESNEEPLIEVLGSSKDTDTTRKPFGTFSRTFSTVKFSDSKRKGEIHGTEKGTAKSVFSTRRPFGGFHRTTETNHKDIELSTEVVIDNKEDIVVKEIVSNKSNLAAFKTFSRPTISPRPTTQEDESLIENDQDNSANDGTTTEPIYPRGRPLRNFARTTLSSQRHHTLDINKAIPSTTRVEEENLETAVHNEENKTEANKKNSKKFPLTTRRYFGSSTRQKTSTTEATGENEKTAKIKEGTITNVEVLGKRISATRRPIAGFTRPTTTEFNIEENTAENAQSDDIENSTKYISSGGRILGYSTEATTESPVDYSTSSESNDAEDVFLTEKILKDETHKKNTEKHEEASNYNSDFNTKDSLETTTPEAVTETATRRRKLIIRKRIRPPTIFQDDIIMRSAGLNVTGLSVMSSEKSSENAVSKVEKITKLYLLKSHTTLSPEVPNATESATRFAHNTEDFAESSTSKELLLATDESLVTKTEEPANSKITEMNSTKSRTFSELNHFQASTKSLEAEKGKQRNNNSFEITTKKTFNRFNKFQSTTEPPLQSATDIEDIEIGANPKKTFNRINFQKPITKTLRFPFSKTQTDQDESASHIEKPSHHSALAFSHFQRLNPNSQSNIEKSSQKPAVNINRYVYNRNRQQHSDVEATNSQRTQLTLSNTDSQRQTFNRPKLQKPLPIYSQTEQEEESDGEEIEDEYTDIDDYDEGHPAEHEKSNLAAQDLAFRKTSSSLLNLRNRIELQKTQDNDSEQTLSRDRLSKLLTARPNTQNTFKTLTSNPSELKTEDVDQEDAITITDTTNTNMFGTNRSYSTVANYLNKYKNNLSQANTNMAPSHINHDNKDKSKIDTDKVDEEDKEVRPAFSNSFKSFVNNVNKGDDNDSNRRFQKYQFQRRTTTTTTTTTAATPKEAEDANEAAKTQVNLNDDNESERITSTNIPETTAPIITESPSSPATPLPRRIKVLKLKRPVVATINNTNTNITANAIASSATNLNASHTETQQIVKLSSSEIESQLSKTETLTETQITSTQTAIPQQTLSPTPKHIRKVIRKLIRPLNRTAEITNEENEKSSVITSIRPNGARFGFNRSTKFKISEEEEVDTQKVTETAEQEDDVKEKSKQETFANRGRGRFTLPNRAAGTTRPSYTGTSNRSRFINKIQPSTTTESPISTEENDDGEDEDEDEEDDESTTDDVVDEEDVKAATSSPILNRLKFTRLSASATESTTQKTDESDSTINTELETTTPNEERSRNTTILTNAKESAEQQAVISSDRFKYITTSHEVEESDDPLLKLRNKVKQDLAKVNQEEGVLSTRLKSTKEASDEVDAETHDPLLKLRNKVKQDLTKTNPIEGVLSDRFKFTKNETELKNKDDSLSKLRNKVKQELAKTSEEEGVVSVKLKQLLENKNTTSTLNYKVESAEIESTTTKDSLNLQKIRDKVQTNLVKNEQDQGVVNPRLKKLLSGNNSPTLLHSNDVNEEESRDDDISADIKEISGDGDFLEETKIVTTTRRPFVSKTKLLAENNEHRTNTDSIITSTTSSPRGKPTFRRRLVAKRPYNPNKPSLSSLSTTTFKTPTTKVNGKYVRHKFGKYHPFNANNHNSGEGFTRTDPRGNQLPAVKRFKIEGSAGGQSDAIEDYEEYDEDADEEEEEEEEIKPEQLDKPNLARPPTLFNRPQISILKKPSRPLQAEDNEDHLDGVVKDEEKEQRDDAEDEYEEEDEDEEEDEIEEENKEEADKSSRPTYKPKDIRVPPAARPTLNTTPTNKKPLTSSRIANIPYRPGALPTTTPSNRSNRYGSPTKSTVKPRVANRPLGVSVPNLTIKPVANDYERTTVLIPTKPAPFINPNTRAYERKYTGPTTESSVDLNIDTNPLIEDLNIEAINARNKKIFDINSKKHTPLKPKAIIPLTKPNGNTQEQQQQTNIEFENDDNDYQSSVDGFATTTTITTINTNTQQQEHEQSTTLDNTTIGTQNTDDANQTNVNNLNEISSQDGFTTTPSPSTTLLHIFTLSDAEHTTQNPLEEGYQNVPRLLVESVKPKHKVVEINRIVEVNSKEEKLRRKSKANTIVPIEGSQTYKVETLPHVEQLGEISVVKYVHQVDGSDITIEGRSTVTDYTPTEPTVAGSSQPIRYSLPDESVQQRYGKALVPEVIREAVETSTISLEGLFETARKGKVLNTIDDADFAKQEINSYNPNLAVVEIATESPIEKAIVTKAPASIPETFNIFKSIAFDVATINLEPNSKEIEIATSSYLEPKPTIITTFSDSSSTSTQNPLQTFSTTTLAPEILSKESTTVASEETKATTVAAALFPQYVRPIVPLLRPESNESSPLVISIANLDKVILSKVSKMANGVEVEDNEQHHASQIQSKQENNIISESQSENPETIKTTNSIPHYQTQQNSVIHDSHAAFSSRLASILKAPLTNSLTQIETQVPSVTNVTKSPLEEVEQVTNTKLYTINEGSVGSTTSSTIGSKISETVSFSSETTVVRRKQPRKAKEKKLKNTNLTTNASATEVLRTPVTVNNSGLTITRRPVLSVRRRLINTSTVASAANVQQTTAPTLTTVLDSSSIINDEYVTTSKFKRLRTNRPPAFNAAAVDITPDTTAATAFKTNNKLKKKSTETTSNDLKLASSSLTSSSSTDNDITSKQASKAQTSAALRRKFQARRLTTTTAGSTNSDGTGTEPPRTQNPLFKRRYSLTTYSPLSVKSGQASKTATTTTSSSSSTLRTAIDSLTTTVYVDGLENDEATDQVAKSSIHTSRFNQINGRLHIDDEDEEELDADISNVANIGVKSLTTLSSATRQPASRFLQQQSPQQPHSKFGYDDIITRRMDGTGIVAKSPTATSITNTTTSTTTTTTTRAISASTAATQAPAIKKRKMIIKRRPQKTTPSSEESLALKRRKPHKYQEPFERINSNKSKSTVKTSTQPGRTYRPNLDYDYYDDEDVRLVGNRSDQQLKVILHGGGIIECLDQGNFPHPLSCRKFISCAKFETGGVVGWEYTCPRGLSYDPVGGMCNWAAGLGCKE